MRAVALFHTLSSLWKNLCSAYITIVFLSKNDDHPFLVGKICLVCTKNEFKANSTSPKLCILCHFKTKPKLFECNSSSIIYFFFFPLNRKTINSNLNKLITYLSFLTVMSGFVQHLSVPYLFHRPPTSSNFISTPAKTTLHPPSSSRPSTLLQSGTERHCSAFHVSWVQRRDDILVHDCEW